MWTEPPNSFSAFTRKDNVRILQRVGESFRKRGNGKVGPESEIPESLDACHAGIWCRLLNHVAQNRHRWSTCLPHVAHVADDFDQDGAIGELRVRKAHQDFWHRMLSKP